MAEAKRDAGTLSPEEALARLGQPDRMLVDVCEGEEMARTGRIAGAVHVLRHVLEFPHGRRCCVVRGPTEPIVC